MQCNCIANESQFMMRYIVICKDESAFYSDMFDPENHWSRNIKCVIDLATDRITFDGDSWIEVEKDHL